MVDNKFWMRIVSVSIGLIYIYFGVLMIQNPNTTLSALSTLMGWFVFVVGIVAIIIAISFRKINAEASHSNMSDGFLLLVLALMFIFGAFINNTLFLSYMLVLWIIMDSTFQLFVANLLPKSGMPVFVMVLDVVLIVYSLFLLFNPSAAEGFLVLYTGFGFISTGFGKLLKSF